jgi:uncharacterized protein (DUF2141 family)
MRFTRLNVLLILFTAYSISLIISCNGGETPPPPNNPCTGVTVSVTGTKVDPTTGNSNGSISASASGGSGITFSLNGAAFQASGNFTGLAAGTYTVTAKTTAGCTGSASFTLTAINPCAGVTITVSATTVNPTTHTGTNGSITVNTSGGAAPLTYSLNGGAFQASNVFNNLGAGNYAVTAKDANGCTGSNSFTLTSPCAGVTITVAGTTVNPTTHTGTNGSITANGTGGIAPYTYKLNSGAFQASGTFNNLGTGTYSITAMDANGCTGSNNFTLVSPCAGVTIIGTGVATNPTTAGSSTGSILANAAGGTGPYTFNLNGGAFQSSPTFNNLAAGNYTIIAKDAIGCTGSASFTLTDPNPCAGVTISQAINTIAHVPCLSNNGSLTSLASGGLFPYTYSLNAGTFQSSGTFNNLAPASYTITAKDANNCQGIANATVGTAAAGPLFSQVRTLLQANCAISGCHNGTQAPNWTIDCNIINNAAIIQQRAVNGNPSPMPPTGLLPASDRQKITDWINAGGRFDN